MLWFKINHFLDGNNAETILFLGDLRFFRIFLGEDIFDVIKDILYDFGILVTLEWDFDLDLKKI